MKNHRLLFLSVFLFILSNVQAQISGIINHYAAVTAIDTCSGKLSVSDTIGFQAGNTVLLIQMQGAQINNSNNAAYGTVTAMNGAGIYERVVIDSLSSTDIFIKNRLVQNYSPTGKVQLVSIPQFPHVIVSDTLRPKPWDGNTGGILVIEVSGTLTLNAPVVANGTGFRGGANYVAPSNGCNWFTPITGYVFGIGNWRGGYKGEGIAILNAGQELGRGPQSNGGGGGNDHNSGGGGGANVSDGGDGGRNADPAAFGCNGNFPGLGGFASPANSDRLFLGGGAGAGHTNNLLRSKGGNGGGIVLLKAAAINGSAPMIYAKGEDAGDSEGDGAGGGGAGGTIWLDLASINPDLVLNVHGGKGGSADNNNLDRCMGPGGGGGGGRILTNTIPGISTVSGGNPGITYNSTVSCNLSSNNAAAGSLGLFQPLSPLVQGNLANTPEVLTDPLPQMVCSGQNAYFNINANSGNWNFQWQVNNGGSWQDISNNSSYLGSQSDSLMVVNPGVAFNGWMFRCKVSRPGCSSVISAAALLQVVPSPTAGFSATVNGDNASFDNLSMHTSSYLWDFGDDSTSNEVTPTHIYHLEGVYTVTLSAWNSCDTVVVQQTVSVFFLPTADFTVPATILGCDTQQVEFHNQSSANTSSFAWTFAGGNPGSSSLENPSVTYATSGMYTARLIVSNAVGTDTIERSFEVAIYQLPTAHFSSQMLPGGLVQFNNLSQNGDTYTWDFGDGSPQENGFNIEHDYTSSGAYVVTLIVSNPCGIALYQQEITVMVLGTDDVKELGALRIFPNPAHQWLSVDWRATGIQVLDIQLFDGAGRVVYTRKQPTGTVIEIPLEALPTGVYQLLLGCNNGRISRAVMKQ